MKSQQHELGGLTGTPVTGGEDDSSSPEQVLISTMNHAALLARQGEHSKAEEILMPLVENDDTRIEIVDLMAKIYAQQGKVERAQHLWIKLLEKDPSNLHVLSALRTCAINKRMGFDSFILKHSWLLISISLWFIFAVFFIISESI